jgi:hypothetical protein
MKLRGLVPNSYIHVSVSVFYISRINRSIWEIGRLILGIYKSLTDHECGNRKQIILILFWK